MICLRPGPLVLIGQQFVGRHPRLVHRVFHFRRVVRVHGHGSAESRQRDIFEWAQPFRPLHDCLNIVLRLLRESAQRSKVSTQAGSYQQQLGGKTYHLAQIRIDEKVGAVPEFSANKYMLWIRFGRLDKDFKTRPFEGNVDFELSLCNL